MQQGILNKKMFYQLQHAVKYIVKQLAGLGKYIKQRIMPRLHYAFAVATDKDRRVKPFIPF